MPLLGAFGEFSRAGGPSLIPLPPRFLITRRLGNAALLSLLVVILALAGCDNPAQRPVPSRNKIIVLAYHAISDNQSNYTTTAARFEKQVASLRARGYNPIGLAELDGYLNKQAPIPEKSFLLTFDDAMSTDYEYVFPFLRKNQLNAVFFVPTGHIGAKGKLDAQQIRTMNDDDCCAFGSHSVSHKNLYTLVAEDLEQELRSSKEVLAAITGEKIIAFAYPSGFFADRDIAALRKYDYRLAFTVMPGLNDIPSSPFEIRRITVSNSLSDEDFQAMVEGNATYYRQYYAQMFAKSTKSGLPAIARLCAEELRRYEGGMISR